MLLLLLRRCGGARLCRGGSAGDAEGGRGGAGGAELVHDGGGCLVLAGCGEGSRGGGGGEEAAVGVLQVEAHDESVGVGGGGGAAEHGRWNEDGRRLEGDVGDGGKV